MSFKLEPDPPGRPTRSRMVRCVCVRGWVAQTGTWPNPCPVCEGYGEISLNRLGYLLREHRSTLARIDEIRTRAGTAGRVLGKLATFLERIGK